MANLKSPAIQVYETLSKEYGLNKFTRGSSSPFHKEDVVGCAFDLDLFYFLSIDRLWRPSRCSTDTPSTIVSASSFCLRLQRWSRVAFVTRALSTLITCSRVGSICLSILKLGQAPVIGPSNVLSGTVPLPIGQRWNFDTIERAKPFTGVYSKVFWHAFFRCVACQRKCLCSLQHVVHLCLLTSGLDNLCLMAGPAKEVLSRHVADEHISAAFVNFPEPPQQARIIWFSSVDGSCQLFLWPCFLYFLVILCCR